MAAPNPNEFMDSSDPLLATSLSLKSIAILNTSRSDFQEKICSNDGLKYDKIVVGAIIIRSSKILLLKRAAHEIYYPNVFELPSGNVEPTDPRLSAALAREVEEETGLRVTKIVEELLPPFEYETSKVMEGVEVRKRCIQVNFLVETEGGEVKVNPEEHSTAVWADEKEIEGLEMTDGMRVLVRSAFEQFVMSKS